MRILTWADFDVALGVIERGLVRDRAVVSAVYGIPRGGLPLAVGLSHRLGVPLMGCPDVECSGGMEALAGLLVVDDIRDSGRTLALWDGCGVLVWTWCKRAGAPGNAALEVAKDDWLIFPWESVERAAADEQGYLDRL